MVGGGGVCGDESGWRAVGAIVGRGLWCHRRAVACASAPQTAAQIKGCTVPSL